MIVTGTTVKNIVHAQASVWLLTSIALLGLTVCIVQFAVGRFIGHYFHRTQEAGQALGQKKYRKERLTVICLPKKANAP